MDTEFQPWSLKILFLDGKIDGMQAVKAPGLNIDILLAPFARIEDARNRQESRRVGIYLLLGENEDGDYPLYIGQSKNIADRIRDHANTKDWWTTAVFITASDNSLNTAHVQYMERNLCRAAQSVGIANLQNIREPGDTALSEEDRNFVEVFLGRLKKILPALRIDVFTENVRAEVNIERADKENLPVFKLQNTEIKVDATAVFENGEMVVQKGSIAREKWSSKILTRDSYAPLTDELLKAGVLRRESSRSVFTCNYAFASVSAAAAVVRGTPAHGPSQWKHAETGETYAEWKATQPQEGGE